MPLVKAVLQVLDEHRAAIRRLVRYSAVSVIATTTSLVMLGVLVGLVGTSAVAANIIATAVGTIPSFELNRRWVWRATNRSLMGQVVPFCILSFSGLALSTVAVGIASAQTASWTHWAHVVAVLVANVAAYGSLWVVQYVLADRVLFVDREERAVIEDIRDEAERTPVAA